MLYLSIFVICCIILLFDCYDYFNIISGKYDDRLRHVITRAFLLLIKLTES